MVIAYREILVLVPVEVENRSLLVQGFVSFSEHVLGYNFYKSYYHSFDRTGKTVLIKFEDNGYF